MTSGPLSRKPCLSTRMKRLLLDMLLPELPSVAARVGRQSLDPSGRCSEATFARLPAARLRGGARAGVLGGICSFVVPVQSRGRCVSLQLQARAGVIGDASAAMCRAVQSSVQCTLSRCAVGSASFRREGARLCLGPRAAEELQAGTGSAQSGPEPTGGAFSGAPAEPTASHTMYTIAPFFGLASRRRRQASPRPLRMRTACALPTHHAGALSAWSRRTPFIIHRAWSSAGRRGRASKRCR